VGHVIPKKDCVEEEILKFLRVKRLDKDLGNWCRKLVFEGEKVG
jgi:hypothetical protein